ncbi:DUF1297 domain-containing protein [Candidatus Peregrinibacteria bacterium]|nr:DUF1297 domain-containing protein [Candidatus Peregrinibacteria bacterium]
MDIKNILKGYKGGKITIGVLGGHSALDVCHGATKYGFDTVVVCQKGREKTYEKYYRKRKGIDGKKIGCVGNIILVDKFADIVKESVQKELRSLNTIFIHNRYFWVYCDFAEIEKEFKVPIFGLREAVKLEERDQPNNQYVLLKKAGIRIPKIFKSAKEIDRLAIVKVNEAQRGYERAFFFADSESKYKDESKKLLKAGIIKESDLKKAVIEEYIVGAHINLNYFYSALTDEVELMGTDTRRQTNLDGFLRLPAYEQGLVRKHMEPKMIETGHYGVTMKESLVEKALMLGEKFVETMKKEAPPGIIGPFALQGAVVAESGKEEFVIFDVSMRIPGSPGTKFTPYSGYLYGESISYGERIAMEISHAVKEHRLAEILT